MDKQWAEISGTTPKIQNKKDKKMVQINQEVEEIDTKFKSTKMIGLKEIENVRASEILDEESSEEQIDYTTIKLKKEEVDDEGSPMKSPN